MIDRLPLLSLSRLFNREIGRARQSKTLTQLTSMGNMQLALTKTVCNHPRLVTTTLGPWHEQIEPSWKYSMASTGEYLTERTNNTWNVDRLQRGGLTAATYATDGIKGNKPK